MLSDQIASGSCCSIKAVMAGGGAQRNLLYMLEVAGFLNARDRFLALLDPEAFSLLDAFVIVFADHLIDALRSGMDRR